MPSLPVLLNMWACTDRHPVKGLGPISFAPSPLHGDGLGVISLIHVLIEPSCSVMLVLTVCTKSISLFFTLKKNSHQSLELTRKMLRDKQNKKNSGQRLPVFPAWVYERPTLVGDFLTGSGLSTDTAVPIGT